MNDIGVKEVFLDDADVKDFSKTIKNGQKLE